VPAILDTLERRIVKDIDQVIAVRVKQVQEQATQLVNHTLEQTHQTVQALVHREMAEAVALTRSEAETLVNSTFDRFSTDADRLIGNLTQAISEQRASVVVDLGDTAATIRKELNRVLVWVALVAGLMNLAGIVIAWFFARGH